MGRNLRSFLKSEGRLFLPAFVLLELCLLLIIRTTRHEIVSVCGSPSNVTHVGFHTDLPNTTKRVGAAKGERGSSSKVLKGWRKGNLLAMKFAAA